MTATQTATAINALNTVEALLDKLKTAIRRLSCDRTGTRIQRL
jgi:hypothetical protein